MLNINEIFKEGYLTLTAVTHKIPHGSKYLVGVLGWLQKRHQSKDLTLYCIPNFWGLNKTL